MNETPFIAYTSVAHFLYRECATLDRTLALFEAITLPSMKSQTSQDFCWAVFVDRLTPASARNRLRELLANNSNFYLVEYDVFDIQNLSILSMRGWLDSLVKSFLLSEGIIKDLNQFIITACLDADDAWHRAVVQTVRACFQEMFFNQGLASGGSLIRTEGAILTFPKGCYWHIASDKVEEWNIPYRAMSCFLLGTVYAGLLASSIEHKYWSQAADIITYKKFEIKTDVAMWLYTRHVDGLARTGLEDQIKTPTAQTTSALFDFLFSTFGASPAKLSEYRSFVEQGLTDGSITDSRSNQVAFDNFWAIGKLFFRIGQLNTELSLLRAKLISPSVGNVSALRKLIDQIELERSRARQEYIELCDRPWL